jgi:hypothetical protein
MNQSNDSKKLGFGDVRKVRKREIWKLAMNKVKKQKNSMQSKIAKQILFYYIFGSTNKKKKKNYMI